MRNKFNVLSHQSLLQRKSELYGHFAGCMQHFMLRRALWFVVHSKLHDYLHYLPVWADLLGRLLHTCMPV